MYAPEYFEVTDPNELWEFVSAHPFGMLLSNGNDGFPIVSHLPFVLLDDGGKYFLEFHVANPNEHLNYLENGATAKMVINGAHGYISSSVYGHENVPTYNYMSVHLMGRVYRLTEEELSRHLQSLVNAFEQDRNQPLDFTSLSPEMITAYSKEITGIRLEVFKHRGIFKLSQNREPNDYQRILNDLKDRESQLDLYLEMKKKCPKK